ncbi:MAG: DUF1684 domain-containing protein [Cyclobacteriaceae bacterium]|nr:DUF1684 domain-containing protein [Cyclobacteriaceae bacterium]
MKLKNIILLLAVVVALISVFYTFRGDQGEAAYTAEINKEREEKDRFMRTAAESPFAENPDTFKGLSYYPPSSRYRIIAELNPIQNKKAVLLSTNDGKEQRYIEYAYAEFDLDGYHNKLLILEIMDMGPFRGKLFLSFGDETSASETYGAGRYLDVVKMSGSKTITLDFNKAYNPYCAYTEKYSCPLPPPENLLRVAIKAGEKIYEH